MAIRTFEKPHNQGFTPLEKSRRKRSSLTGFTLMEVLLAIAILAFALCAILFTYISCLALIATSKNVNIATDAALGLMEGIRGDPFSRIFTDYNKLNFTVGGMPANMGVVYVDKTNPSLLKVTISVCWRQGNRIIGEDTNLNGILNTGEDANNNGIIDSPVELVTLIASR